MADIITPEPLTTVPFYELGGSPSEIYTSEGFKAVRKFLVAWDDRDAFANDVMGNVKEFDYSYSTYYPKRPDALPVKLTFSPVDDMAVNKKEITQMHTSLNSYSGSWALATVEYETLGTQDVDSISISSGTRLTYRLTYEPQEILLPVSGWVWNESTESLPENTIITKRVPQTLHTLVWSMVISPPWNTIQETQGKINSQKFLDCPTGTLLFEGISANKLYRSTLEAGASKFTWQITYTFRQQCIHHSGNVYGWNHLFRGNTGTWCPPVNNSIKIYDEADFSLLFLPE
ncbi:MAG: hypothetical protein Q4C96_00170 [Planctomycetia bacterium]|nr:hypothetical protein [Planctomycetia bacterium]